MDLAPTIDVFSLWLMQYGSIALFVLLTVGIIALPVPEETLMVIAGILMHKGTLSIPYTMLAAFLGALCGISFSYFLGRTAGFYLIKKYGRWIGLTEQRTQKAHNWFERFGKWALLIGYFIPGVRHLTGISAGISGFSYKYFALYAYMGALIWVSLFLSIGYFFGKQWLALYGNVKESSTVIFIAIGIFILCVLGVLYKKWRKK